MVEATPPTLAARNAFAVLLVVLMLLYVYQAVATIEDDLVIEVLFYLGASVYALSLYYYRGDSAEEEPPAAGMDDDA